MLRGAEVYNCVAVPESRLRQDYRVSENPPRAGGWSGFVIRTVELTFVDMSAEIEQGAGANTGGVVPFLPSAPLARWIGGTAGLFPRWLGFCFVVCRYPPKSGKMPIFTSGN
jgi:hypothetical protein